VVTGTATGVVVTSLGDRSWGWGFAALGLASSVLCALMGPLTARARRRAEEREARHIRDMRAARRGRR
jgi:hypothetical protein